MANKDLRLFPHHKRDRLTWWWWWYEEKQGISVIATCKCGKELVLDIPWNVIRKALARKDKK